MVQGNFNKIGNPYNLDNSTGKYLHIIKVFYIYIKNSLKNVLLKLKNSLGKLI